VANPSLGVKSVPELLARAKTESISFASSGVGTTSHMAQEMFRSRVGVPFTHVPYKGTAQSVNDAVGGHSPLLFESPGPLLGHIRDGKLVPLASTGGRRSAALPNVATFEEQGYKGVRLEGWIGLVVPASTPAPIVNKIAQACQTALATAEMQSQALSQGFDIDYAGPRDFGAFITSELQKWGELVRLAGVKPE
jgi:tripartite-type tricarboxylate transporter receptor subunit TctC